MRLLMISIMQCEYGIKLRDYTKLEVKSFLYTCKSAGRLKQSCSIHDVKIHKWSMAKKLSCNGILCKKRVRVKKTRNCVNFITLYSKLRYQMRVKLIGQNQVDWIESGQPVSHCDKRTQGYEWMRRTKDENVNVKRVELELNELIEWHEDFVFDRCIKNKVNGNYKFQHFF